MQGRTLVVALAAAIGFGCAVQKAWIPVGGSRSDGTVKLSYDYGGLQVPKVDNEQGHQMAIQKCAAWGYSGAEAFEGVERTCTATNAYGCIAFRVTATFQCTGQPK